VNVDGKQTIYFTGTSTAVCVGAILIRLQADTIKDIDVLEALNQLIAVPVLLMTGFNLSNHQ